jgi:Nucleotidyl transferase AbiEii toxin, Type IV TA system
MFKLEHHRKILVVLSNLNSQFFRKIGAYFGGGTQLALQYGEYRWSRDIDFLCPVGPGYRILRNEINTKGYEALFNPGKELEFPRDIKADQYGVRFAVIVDGTPLKFEIIAEGRIELDEPASYDWCPVPCLNFDDACAEKLLSNADRWADESVESRDLIDLAVLRLQAQFSESPFKKANEAYDVRGPLVKALNKFLARSKYRNKCFSALQIENRSTIMSGIELLASDHGLELNLSKDEDEEI